MERGVQGRSRSEIQSQVDQNIDQLKDQEEKANVPVEDAEVIAQTLDSLEQGGSSDGVEAVEQSIDSAGEAAESVFDEISQDWEQTQNEGEEHSSEMEESKQSVERDLGIATDAGENIQTEEVTNKYIGIKENLAKEGDFFEEEITESRQATEESQNKQQELQQKLQSTLRS